MNYIFSYFGKKPDHLLTFLNNILSVDSEAKIYFLSDFIFKSNLINTYNLNDYPNLLEKKNLINDLLSGTNLISNPLWSTSLLRVHAVNTIALDNNIKEFVHFDTDVLIYKSFNELRSQNLFEEDKINITPYNSNKLIFGYSYFPNLSTIKTLEELFEKVFSKYSTYSNKYALGGALNEMAILGISKEINKTLFHPLSTLPYFGEKIIFDPASYGQYLDGTHLKRGNYIIKRRWISTSCEVGRELKSKRIFVEFKNHKPAVLFNDKKIELANLHIHSKRLNKYLPLNHKLFIK